MKFFCGLFEISALNLFVPKLVSVIWLIFVRYCTGLFFVFSSPFSGCKFNFHVVGSAAGHLACEI